MQIRPWLRRAKKTPLTPVGGRVARRTKPVVFMAGAPPSQHRGTCAREGAGSWQRHARVRNVLVCHIRRNCGPRGPGQISVVIKTICLRHLSRRHLSRRPSIGLLQTQLTAHAVVVHARAGSDHLRSVVGALWHVVICAVKTPRQVTRHGSPSRLPGVVRSCALLCRCEVNTLGGANTSNAAPVPVVFS